MSFERAYINCQRCYEIAKADNIAGIACDNLLDSLYVARNEAMKALEELYIHRNSRNLSAADVYKNVYEGLTACMNCDYSKPSIANLVEDLTKEKPEESEEEKSE